MTQWPSISPNLALDQAVRQRLNSGQSVVHLGFGESRIPIPAELTDCLAIGARRTMYGPIAGSHSVRQAAAGYFSRRRLPTEPDQVIVAPGSKPLLMALMALIDGDVLLPRPCWVTYAPQARLFGRAYHHVPVPDVCGGVPDPDALREKLREVRIRGRCPGALVLTIPDNPTGTIAPSTLVRQVCEIARQEDLTIISDEIYRDIPHDSDALVVSPAEVAPERTVVTGGLSKSLALGGWRIGFARFPDMPKGRSLRDGVLALASEVWSTLAGPMQDVAAYALAEPARIRDHLEASARLHGRVAAAVHRIVVDAGASCRAPTGGFYVYPDFESVRGRLGFCGIHDSASLQTHLLDELGVAILGGAHFGDDPRALRFRAATSLLYGESDEQRSAALSANDPLHLPWVESALVAVREAFTELVTS